MPSRDLTAESLQAVFRAGESGWPEWGDKCCGCCTGRGCFLRARPSALAALIAMFEENPCCSEEPHACAEGAFATWVALLGLKYIC